MPFRFVFGFRLAANLATRQRRSDDAAGNIVKVQGLPVSGLEDGQIGCASFPARTLCSSSASASCLTTGMGERLRRVFGSFTVRFHTLRSTNKLPITRRTRH